MKEKLQKIVTDANKKFNVDFLLNDFDDHNIILWSPTMGSDDTFDKKVDLFGDYMVSKTGLTVEMKYGFKNKSYIVTHDGRKGDYVDLLTSDIK